MKTIEQALFGYSNGHRMLASSLSLSISSQRLLEVLSDLSGNDSSTNFNGYYTGCWLPDDNLYAISKTWYADEMPRPGCAWTHTLIFDEKNFSTKINFEFDELFKRPQIDKENFLEVYKSSFSIEKKECLNDFEKTLFIFKLIIYKKDNIVVLGKDSYEFNEIIKMLFQLMGVSFFKHFSFCTGSQANRFFKNKPLNLQIMPINISKLALRTLTVFETLDESDEYILDLDSINDILEIKNFMIACNIQFYSFKTFDIFQKIYNTLYKSHSINLDELITVNKQNFSNDIAINMFVSEINVFIKDKIMDTEYDETFSNLLYNLSVLNDLVFIEFINSLSDVEWVEYKNSLFPKKKSIVFKLITSLLTQKLNDFGEKLLSNLSFCITSDDFVNLLVNKQLNCIVLLQLNWELAICNNLWKMPSNIQFEMIKNIAVFFNKVTEVERQTFEKLLFIVFEYSDENIYDEIYKGFGDFSLCTYFKWLNQDKDIYNYNWVNLCKNNAPLSLMLLLDLNKKDVCFYNKILNVLDPWDKTLKNVSCQTWEVLYQHCNRDDNKDLLAKFMLQVVINTNVKLSDSIMFFIFKRVHKILEESNYEDSFWNKISRYLPEVKWYNSWDKCKRLRKYAEKIGYKNIF